MGDALSRLVESIKKSAEGSEIIERPCYMECRKNNPQLAKDDYHMICPTLRNYRRGQQ